MNVAVCKLQLNLQTLHDNASQKNKNKSFVYKVKLPKLPVIVCFNKFLWIMIKKNM